jgi:hypothetical protein
MRVYTASGWIDASSASVATLGTFKFTATGGQTSFSGTGDTGIALSYTVGAVIVSLNGVLLEEGSEYTATTGSSIVLSSGASAGDELNVYAFGNFLVADTYSRSEADSKYVPNTTGIINIGSVQIYKDAIGKVGISTTSPLGKLEVKNGYSWFTAPSTDSAVIIHHDGTLGTIQTSYNATGSYTPLTFKTSEVERMRIDSAGRVTMPNQPAFRARRTLGAFTGAGIIRFDTADYNRGSHYNSSNGVFTAPVAGAYFFAYCIETQGGGNNFLIKPRKNGSLLVVTEMQISTSSTSGFGYSLVVDMAANDTFDLYLDGGYTIYGNGSYTFISGYLIG